MTKPKAITLERAARELTDSELQTLAGEGCSKAFSALNEKGWDAFSFGGQGDLEEDIAAFNYHTGRALVYVAELRRREPEADDD